ncbi:MAG: hypothetical protein U5K28_05175 [Halobacteriales archaeon]|nr:hypothetical protein [Halobacteriales archaeon]
MAVRTDQGVMSVLAASEIAATATALRDVAIGVVPARKNEDAAFRTGPCERGGVATRCS